MTEPSLKYLTEVLCYSDPMGSDLPPNELISAFKQFHWRDTVARLGHLAAVLSNVGPNSTRAMELTNYLIASFEKSGVPVERTLAIYIASQRHRVIANEQCIYFATAMAILHGRDDGEGPSDGFVAYLLLAANDYAFDWANKNDEALPRLDKRFVTSVRSMIYDRRREGISEIVRPLLVFDDPPPQSQRPEWSDSAKWMKFQEEALQGLTTREYLTRLGAPLYLGSRSWGRDSQNTLSHVLRPSEYFSLMSLSKEEGETFLQNLSIDRKSAQEKLRRSTQSDLPLDSSLFYKHPFIRFDEGLLAVSPWVVQEHLRRGIWALLNREAQKSAKDDEAKKDLMRVFGLLVERWCRTLTDEVAKSQRFQGRVIPSTIGGANELEDIVIVNPCNSRKSKTGGARLSSEVILISIKSTAMEESILKKAQSRSGAIKWYEDFLFFERRKGDRKSVGALRQLNSDIVKVRDGRAESLGIARQATIFPVIVTYDELGLDNPHAYDWVAAQCKERDLCRQGGVRAVTFSNMPTFEAMMGAAESGHSLFEILRAKVKPRWFREPLSELLLDKVPSQERLCAGFVSQKFEEILGGISGLFSSDTSVDPARPNPE